MSVPRPALSVLCVLAQTLWASEAPSAKTIHTDSRSPYVHRLTLYRADGEVIGPADKPAQPYSGRATCGKCHPYDRISRGWHFNAGTDNAEPGRPGEPWWLVDVRTGTQLPLSLRDWPGTFPPAAVGVTPWQLALRFGAHFPGGGIAERHVGKPLDPKARWGISGRLEISCMICHSASPGYDAAERAHHIERQLFQWLGVVSNGIGIVQGDARRLPDDFDPDFPDLAGPDVVPPKVLYDQAQFDANDRVLLPTGLRPAPERCAFCHTTRPVGPGSPEPWQQDRDVHAKAGLTCADCHRHGIDHAMARGDETADPAKATLSCRGCHLGTDSAAGGRLGAPQPAHRGLPAYHLEKLACTACHSGPMPGQAPLRVQTSRAHGLGLPSKHRGPDAAPLTMGPVFARNATGQIAAHRLVWPAFWGLLQGDAVTPLAPAAVVEAAAQTLGAPEAKEYAPLVSLSDDTIAAVLEALRRTAPREDDPVYVRDGLLYRLGSDGGLNNTPHPAAAAYLWPMGHDVRPAGRSLGAGGCTDCHRAGSPFFFGQVPAAPAAKPMHEFMSVEPKLLSAWERWASLRTAFIVATLICCAVLAALLQFALSGLLGLIRQNTD